MGKYDIGKRYGRLTIIKSLPSRITKSGRTYGVSLVRCDCGNIIEILNQSLTSGRPPTKSCGCLHKDIVKKGKFAKKYKYSNHMLYNVWNKMKERCYSKTSKGYSNYGDRGITICKEWLLNYDSFFMWSINNGYKQGLEIDRIDNNGDYTPDNCRWVTSMVNGNNKRNNIIVKYQRTKGTLSNILRKLNIHHKYKKVHRRIYQLHWSFEKAIQNL